jgi:hypothetical protein
MNYINTLMNRLMLLYSWTFVFAKIETNIAKYDCCTKITTTEKDNFGKTTVKKEVIPCDKPDCPAKKHGFGDV